MTPDRLCKTCGSIGFGESLLGPNCCQFCDGTEGGNPPSNEEIACAEHNPFPGATVKVQCERCKKECDCDFYGCPSDVNTNKAQNGEWLCRPCVPLRAKEMDDAIFKMKGFLKHD